MNNQNNKNSNQSLTLPDSKTTMIRKRKRNEKPDTNSQYSNIPSNIDHKILNKIKHHEYCHGVKPFSIISEERCVICKEELTIPSPDTYSCSQCFKYYHKKCLSSIQKELNNHTEIICILCEKHTAGKCILCNKQINSDSEIQVCCELCGNLMHLDCLNGIPLQILYKRRFYEMLTTNNVSISHLAGENIDLIAQEFETALKFFEEKYSLMTNSTSSMINMVNNFGKSAEVGESDSIPVEKFRSSLNKKEILRNFLKEFFFNKIPLAQLESNRKICNDYIEKLCNLFYICRICLWNVDKKDKVNFFEFKIAKGTAFKRINFKNLATIHEIFAIATMIKNDSIDLGESKTAYEVDKIIDFYHLNRNCADEGYYLIKWRKNNVKYSFEYSKFVEAFEEFPKFRQEFEKRKRREIEYYELFFNWQLGRKNENNSKSFARIDSHDSFEKLWSKSFLQEFEKNSLDYASDLNAPSDSLFAHSIIEDLESHHILILNEIKSIDELRKTFLTPLMNKIIEKDTFSNYSNNNFNPSPSINYFQIKKPKVLICFDNNKILQKWKDIFSSSLSNSSLTYFVYRLKNRFQRILYEMFYLDLSKISTGLKSIIYKDLDSRQTNPEEFFKLFDTLITDYNHTKFDVILIDKNEFLFEYLNLFSKINFDLILMDFLERDSVIKVKEIIKLNSIQVQQKNSNHPHTTKLIILKSMDIMNNADNFEMNFSNFLFNFYTANDYLIIPPANQSGLKMLSKGIQFFPVEMDEMLDYLRREFKWAVVNQNSNTNTENSIRRNPHELSNSEKSNYFYLTREESILELDLTFPRIILNFISVNLTKTELLQYVSILRERKHLVLNKKQENKTDLIKNLSAFCAFPGLMVKYYLNKLEDKNLKLSDDCVVNQNKIKSLKNLIENIFLNGNENFEFLNEDENSFNQIHVNVIYSEPNLETESRSSSVFKFLKQSVMKHFEKERKFIHFYSLSTDYEDIFSHSQDHNVFIFFNLFLTPKITGKFFRRMFNCFKNRNLFIFQMFIENSIEQNLVEEFYTSAAEEILSKENILINLMSKETKENVLKKNLMNLKYSESNSAGGSISDDGFIFNSSENIKLELSNFDGLIVVDNCIQIFTKNSNFIQGPNQSQNKCDQEWDYILDEYFSEEKLTNSKDEFNFIQTRNKKIYNTTNNHGMWSDNSSAIIEKSSVKKAKLIIDDEDEDLPDYIIRTSVDNHKTMNKKADILAMCSSLAAKPNKPLHNQAFNVEVSLLEEESLKVAQTNLINKMTDKSLIDKLISENPTLSQSIKKSNDRNSGLNSNSAVYISNNGQTDVTLNKFKNLSVLSTSNISYEKNPNMSINKPNPAPKRIDFEAYLALIESDSADYVSNDILHDLNNVLMNSGMNLHIRKLIITYVMKFGIDMDNLDEYINTLHNEIKSHSNSGKEIKIDLLRFYIEYMLIILSKCNTYEQDTYYQLYFFSGGFRLLSSKPGEIGDVESSQTGEIKRRILISMKLNEFMNLSIEKIKEGIRNLFQVITKTLSTSANLKFKFSMQSYNPEIFVNFIMKFLKSILTYGYGEYKQIVDSYNNCLSSELSIGLNAGNVHDGQKLKFFLLWMITSPPIKNDLNVDSILAEFLEELFIILEKNILDKF